MEMEYVQPKAGDLEQIAENERRDLLFHGVETIEVDKGELILDPYTRADEGLVRVLRIYDGITEELVPAVSLSILKEGATYPLGPEELQAVLDAEPN